MTDDMKLQRHQHMPLTRLREEHLRHLAEMSDLAMTGSAALEG